MNREQKQEVIDGLKSRFDESGSFYLADASGLTVAEVNRLRRICFEKGVQLRVAKNTLIKKAFDACEADYSEIESLLNGPTAILFTEVSNMPARVIKEFRSSGDKPVLKGAYIDSSIFIGDEKLDELSKLKSKEELIGDVILLLQSPIKNVVSALQSGGQTISGLVKALEGRTEA